MTKELVRSQSFSVRSYDAASKAVALSEAKFVDEVMKIHDETDCEAVGRPSVAQSTIP
jgi:hypothetical protein